MMSKNKTSIYIFALLLVSLALVACAGFDPGDWVQVKTPNSIQQTTGLAATIALNDAESEYQAWFENVKRTGAKWRANIQRSNEIRGILNQLTLSSLDTVGPSIAGLPVLGPALPALTGLLGIFLGTGNLRKHKEKSFNKGLEKGQTADNNRNNNNNNNSNGVPPP